MLRSEDPELYLEKAVHRLCDYYGKALTLEYVRNKIAWALYQTWKEFDKKSEERRMTLYDSDASEEYLLDGRYVIKPLVRCKDCKYYLDSSERYGIVDTRLHFYECGIIDTRLRFYETDKRWTGDSFCSWAERREE